MKNYLKEVLNYFWIPLIMGLMSYIFFQLHDVLLGVVALVALSAAYTLIRLYLLHKKWWLLALLALVALGSLGFAFSRAPTATLYINGQEVSGSSITLSSGTVSVNPAPEPNGEYANHTRVTLTANPSSGYDWKAWTGTQNDASNPTTITVGQNKQITVNFEPRVSLIINNQQVIGSYVSFSQGSITVSPAPDGDGKYSSGTVVTLSAQANPGYDWTGWLGSNTDTLNPATVNMSGTVKNITAIFEPRFFLTISNQLVIGSTLNFAQGSVSISPTPGSDGKYAYGTRVVLTAKPAPGFDWASWAGTGNDLSNPAAITINSDKYISVTFAQRFALTINGQPASGGSVTLTGGLVSINPATGTDGLFSNGSTETLTAAPADGYRFDHWTGDVSGNNATITININSNKNVTAVFVQIFTLNITINPANGGSISPNGGTYDIGSSVTLTAVPASGYAFDHWTGDVSGTSTTITINMNSNKNVTAIFVPSSSS